MFKTYILLFILSTATYFGAYGEIQGLQNISMVVLWVFTIVFFILSFFINDEEKKKKKKNTIIVNLIRFWFLTLIGALIYGGEIEVGAMWLISIITIKTVNVNVKVEDDEQETTKSEMFKKLTEDATLPLAQTKYSAGYDVCASEDVTIYKGQTKLVPLGIALDLTAEDMNSFKDCFIGLYLRSSYGAKGLILPNGVGIIDIDYTGEIKQIIHNASFENKPFIIKKGDRVGQLILHKHHGSEWLGDKYRKGELRVGGFGSTNN